MPSETNVIGGHKATIHNANTSEEAKENSKEILKDEHNSIFASNNPIYEVPRY